VSFAGKSGIADVGSALQTPPASDYLGFGYNQLDVDVIFRTDFDTDVDTDFDTASPPSSLTTASPPTDWSDVCPATPGSAYDELTTELLDDFLFL